MESISLQKNLVHMPKYIILLSMLYLATFLFPLMLAYRMVQLGPLLEPGGTLLFPASYLFADIIAEVYGYRLSRQLLWSAVFCQLFLAFSVILVLYLPFPSNWHEEPDFDVVLGHILRYAIASSIGNFLGEFTNIYFITKFKVLLRGKFFWLRSLGSSCFGEAVLTLVVFFITFSGIVDPSQIIKLTLSAYLYKVVFAFVGVFPAAILVKFLKRAEGIDVYDYSTNFNPFKFSLGKEEIANTNK